MRRAGELLSSFPVRRARPHELLAIAIGLSIVAHGAAGVVLYAGHRDESVPGDGAMELTELQIAPDAPEAHTPHADDQAAPPSVNDDEVDPGIDEPPPEPANTLEARIDEPKQNDEVAQVADAGPSDGGAAIATTAFDAGAGDGGAAIAATTLDAGAGGGGTAIAATDLDGGGTAVALDGDGGPGGDGSTAIAASGAGDPGGDPNAPPAPAGADANLLAYFPAGERVTVLMRLGRIRGTPWAAKLEDMMRPMPDYKSIIGKRGATIADLFDALVISTPEPTDVTKTTLVARFSRKPSSMRRFLDHRGARVRWRSSRGGALGERLKSPVVAPNDRRVFLLPMAGWITLARPALVGSLSRHTSHDLNAYPPPAVLPPWLQQIPAIEHEAGDPVGPALVVTLQDLAARIELPIVGGLDLPDRITVALTLDPHGFIARGNMLFASDAAAAKFIVDADRMKKDVTESYLGKLALARVHAFNAVNGLSFKQAGPKVGFATSLSVADALELVARAAVMVQAYFDQARQQPVPRIAPGKEPHGAP